MYISDKVAKNAEIRARKVLVIDQDGNKLGEMSTKEALKLAEQSGVDLVLVAPEAKPPVARMMDYGKYIYEKEKKEKLAKKKQKKQVLKEMKFRLRIDEHDFNTKLKKIREFLEDGYKVRVVIMFLGRDILFKEKGKEILDRVVSKTSDIAKVSRGAKLLGKDMDIILEPITEDKK
ncbi:translation initiation factor IF-3 [Petrotoga olearia]|uniref:Translation initiation factor IF-3 n=2 Tax=Petrotoga olearia TaxID=156203 RepID=A0A2K1P450_9BACT|nr:translation initiation factor IF-3 [Petrotoga olearia]PNR97552.1 translation initiation factor IF-3 [Petrotoga olearia DSM 13574]RMA75279.1 translation initiation factor 3 (bIF-3) [Petrotoga olearia]